MNQRTDSRGALLVRTLGNWLNLSTPLGLGIALLGGASLRRGPRGIWLAEGYRLSFPPAGAFAVGSVVVVTRQDLAGLQRRQPRVLEHEEAHVWQWCYCLGLPFLAAYGLASLWSWVRYGDWHSGNWFEVAADLAKGGYQRGQPRNWRGLVQRTFNRADERSRWR